MWFSVIHTILLNAWEKPGPWSFCSFATERSQGEYPDSIGDIFSVAGSTYYQHCLGANGFTSSELRQRCEWYGHLGLAADVGKVILRCHCCDMASCHGSYLRKMPTLVFLRRRIWGNLEEHPGPHPEVVVCPGLRQCFLSFLVFHWLQWTALQGFHSVLSAKYSPEKKEEAESLPLCKEKLSHHCFGDAFYSLYERMAHTFQAGHKISAVFVLSLLNSEEVFYIVMLGETES